MFGDERGRIIEQEVFNEWKPTLCGKCKNFDHEMQECRQFLKEEKEKLVSQQVQQDTIGRGVQKTREKVD